MYYALVLLQTAEKENPWWILIPLGFIAFILWGALSEDDEPTSGDQGGLN